MYAFVVVAVCLHSISSRILSITFFFSTISFTFRLRRETRYFNVPPLPFNYCCIVILCRHVTLAHLHRHGHRNSTSISFISFGDDLCANNLIFQFAPTTTTRSDRQTDRRSHTYSPTRRSTVLLFRRHITRIEREPKTKFSKSVADICRNKVRILIRHKLHNNSQVLSFFFFSSSDSYSFYKTRLISLVAKTTTGPVHTQIDR